MPVCGLDHTCAVIWVSNLSFVPGRPESLRNSSPLPLARGESGSKDRGIGLEDMQATVGDFSLHCHIQMHLPTSSPVLGLMTMALSISGSKGVLAGFRGHIPQYTDHKKGVFSVLKCIT